MNSLPTSLFRAEQVRELDRIAIEERGIPGITLMERAGQVAWDTLQSTWPEARTIDIVCGGGNNAGDGYILARLALENNCSVRVFPLSDPAALQGDARTAATQLKEMADVCQTFDPDQLGVADVIVDALLGTGIDRDVSDEFRQAIEAINTSGRPVLAIDIPSGLNADTGRIMGQAVDADTTITFIGLKQGLFTGQGVDCCGPIRFTDLEVPSDVYAAITASAQRIDLAGLGQGLPPRPRSAHKGSFGHALLVGGDMGFAGAIRMAAESAARVGSGLVSVASRPQHAALLSMAVPELMARGIEQGIELNPLLDQASVIGIGPGLGQSDWGADLLSRVLESKLPLVIDADALNLIAREPIHSNRWVLTPHPGEAARLLRTSTADVQADRLGAASTIQERFGGVTVLKGSGTIIVDAEGKRCLCSDGNPGMATGGMGDVLTGIITGLIAQGLSIADAARLGVCLHAAAGDRAAKEGERGLLATDLMPWIRHLVNGQ